MGIQVGSPGSGHIVLLGEMGVGKTTVGRALANRLGRPFLDSDELIESETGISGAEIADRSGVDVLHERELETLAVMIGMPESAVIAPASSVVDQQRGRELLHESTNIWLTASDEVVAHRREHGSHRRGVTAEERGELRRRRQPYLERLASIEVDTSSSTPGQVARTIADALARAGLIAIDGEVAGPATDGLS